MLHVPFRNPFSAFSTFPVPRPFRFANFPSASYASGLCMKRLLITLALLLAGALCSRAQFGSFGDIPIEITSESTRMENGLAIAENSVFIRYGETAIYCDYAQYNPDTRDVYLSGNV